MPTEDGKLNINDLSQIMEANRKSDSAIEKIDALTVSVGKDIYDIKNNHLNHIEADIGVLKTDGSIMKTDLAWIKKFQWLIITSIVSTLITMIVGLIFVVIKLN